MSSDSADGNDAVGVKIVDAKEVFVPGNRRAHAIPSKALVITETGDHYMHIKPSKFRGVAKLLVSMCPQDVRTAIGTKPAFWTGKDASGKLFLDWHSSYFVHVDIV